MKYKVFYSNPNTLERRYLTSAEKAEFLHLLKLDHFKFLLPFKTIEFTLHEGFYSSLLGYLEENSVITLFFERQ